jgi:hypothetical protein
LVANGMTVSDSRARSRRTATRPRRGPSLVPVLLAALLVLALRPETAAKPWNRGPRNAPTHAAHAIRCPIPRRGRDRAEGERGPARPPCRSDPGLP